MCGAFCGLACELGSLCCLCFEGLNHAEHYVSCFEQSPAPNRDMITWDAVITSVPELVAAFDEYIVHHDINPKLFIWIKSDAMSGRR